MFEVIIRTHVEGGQKVKHPTGRPHHTGVEVSDMKTTRRCPASGAGVITAVTPIDVVFL